MISLECSKLLHQKKQTNLQWLQGKKEGEYLKYRITVVEINSKNKNIRYTYKGIMNLRNVTALSHTW
jgi:hypothetical protein